MAVKRVTMQEIADACGLSRNTVSKIFNDRGAVPEATKKLVLQKAQELGYGQIPEDAPEGSPADAAQATQSQFRRFLYHELHRFDLPRGLYDEDVRNLPRGDRGEEAAASS